MFAPVGVKVCRLHGLTVHMAWLSVAIPDLQVPTWYKDQEPGIIACCESQPWDPVLFVFASGNKGICLPLNRGAGHATLVSFTHRQSPVVSPLLSLSLCLTGTSCLSLPLLFLTLNEKVGKFL